MKKNILVEKSLLFAARILKLQKYLVKVKKESVVSKQIVRRGTSIGANINEANYAQSRADFVFKMQIALKETAETEYWIKLLILAEYIGGEMSDSLLEECIEIKRLLVATLNTAKESIKQ